MFKKKPWFLQLFLNFLAFHLFQQNSPCSSVNILQTFSLCCCLWNQSQRGIAGQGEELITPALVSWKLGANKCPGLWITWASSADTAQPWTTQTSLQSVYSNVSHPLNPPTFRYLLQKTYCFPFLCAAIVIWYLPSNWDFAATAAQRLFHLQILAYIQVLITAIQRLIKIPYTFSTFKIHRELW